MKEDWDRSQPAARLLWGLLLVCVGTFLLFLCSSMAYHRKRRRQVQHGFSVKGGSRPRDGNDATSHRKRASSWWRSDKDVKKSGSVIREATLQVIPTVSIIITPPTPMLSLHSSRDIDGQDSIGSVSDLISVSLDQPPSTPSLDSTGESGSEGNRSVEDAIEAERSSSSFSSSSSSTSSFTSSRTGSGLARAASSEENAHRADLDTGQEAECMVRGKELGSREQMEGECPVTENTGGDFPQLQCSVTDATTDNDEDH